jgi:hypothetical protein
VQLTALFLVLCDSGNSLGTLGYADTKFSSLTHRIGISCVGKKPALFKLLGD